MMLNIFLFVLGFLLLIKGADLLVTGSSALARKFGISDLVIGLTIVAFGTSAPEMVVNLYASVQNYQDIVLGNVIGSNLFNLFLILGLAGLVSPLVVKSSTVWKEIPFSLLATLMLLLLANFPCLAGRSMISFLDGMVLLAAFVVFLIYVFHQLRTDKSQSFSQPANFPTLRIWLYVILGLAGLIIGGRITVINAVELARLWGMDEKIIGLTIVAAGTSLPELATSVVASLKKNNDIAIGNIIGSNIFNILLILAASAVIRPIQYDTAFNTELFLLLGGTVFLFLAMFTGKQKKLDRWEALILLAIYVAYMFWMIMSL